MYETFRVVCPVMISYIKWNYRLTVSDEYCEGCLRTCVCCSGTLWSDYSRLDFCRPGGFRATLPMLKIPWPPMTTGRAVLAVVFVRRVYALSDEHLIPLPTDGEENNQILVQTSDTVSTLPLLADRCVLH